MKAQATQLDSVELRVRLSVPELTALSHVAVVVTSATDTATINAAERGLRAMRVAAANHPGLPEQIKERRP